VLQCVLQCVAVCVVECVAMCFNVLQCVAVHCKLLPMCSGATNMFRSTSLVGLLVVGLRSSRYGLSPTVKTDLHKGSTSKPELRHISLYRQGVSLQDLF